MLSSLLRRPPLHREALYGASPTALFCRGVRMVRMRLCDMRMLLIWISIFVSGLSLFLFRGLVEVVIFGMLWRSARINMSVERLRSRKGKRHSFYILVLLVFFIQKILVSYSNIIVKEGRRVRGALHKKSGAYGDGDHPAGTTKTRRGSSRAGAGSSPRHRAGVLVVGSIVKEKK